MTQTIRPRPPAKTPARVAFALAALLGLAGTGVAQDPEPPPAPAEAHYKGKPTAHWVKRLQEKDPAARREAMQALAAIGPDAATAAPAILRGLDDDDTAVREGALDALAGIGPAAKAAVPTLVRALADKDVQYRDKAIKALDAIGASDVAIVTALAGALIDPDPRRRSGTAALSLQRRGPAAKAAVPVLKKALAGTDSGQRVMVVHVLRYLGPDAAPVLIALWKDRDPNVRSEVFNSLYAMGPQAGAAIPALAAAVRDRDAAPHAIRALGSIGPDALPTLTEILKGGDPRDAVDAATAIGGMGPRAKDAVPALVEALKNRVTAATAGHALTDVGPAAVPALVDALKDKACRPHAFDALIRMGPRAKDAVPALIEVLKADDMWWQTAASALQHIGPDAIPALLKAAADPDNERAAPILWSMGRQKPETTKAVVRGLVEMLKNPEEQLRQRAAATLGQIGEGARPAAPALEEALKDPNAGVRRAAADALKNIAPK
jgi:HEAT repeat protein